MKAMRTTALLAALLLAMTGVLSGCGDSGTSTTSGGTGSSPAGDSSGTGEGSEPAKPSYLDEKHDFEGKTITFENLFVGEADDYPGYFKEGGEHEGYIEEVETKYNCDIKFVAGIGIDDLIGQILSGQANRTILYKQPWDFYPLAQGGYLTKLNGVLDDDYWDNLPGFMSAVTKAHTYNGDIYGFGTGYDSYHVMAALGYNRSMIERNNLEDPMDLYKNGEWTREKFTELSKAVTKDTNNDGQTDQWGITMSHAGFLGYFFMSNGVSPVVQDASGKYISGWKNNPAATNALNQLYSWMMEDKIFAPNQVANEVATFADNKSTLFFFTAIYQFQGFPDRMTDEYGVVPYPVGPDVEDKTKNIMPTVVTMSFMLPKNAENPRGLVAVADSLYRSEDYAARFERYASSLTVDRDSYEAMLTGFNNMKPEYVGAYQTFVHAYLQEMFNGIANDGLSATAAFEMMEPMIQETLDNTLNVVQ